MSKDLFDYKDSQLFTPEETSHTIKGVEPYFTPRQRVRAADEAGTTLTQSLTAIAIGQADKMEAMEDIPAAQMYSDYRQDKIRRLQTVMDFSNEAEFRWYHSAAVMFGQASKDPVGVALYGTIGLGGPAVGGLAKRALPALAEYATSTLAKRVATGVVGGVAEGIVQGELEVWATRGESEVSGVPFTEEHASMIRKYNTVIGGVVGGVLGLGMKAFVDKRAYRESVADLTIYEAGKNARLEYRAKARAELEYKPEYDLIRSSDIGEYSWKSGKGSMGGPEVVSGKPDIVLDTKFYSVHHGVNNGNFGGNSQYSYGTNFGTKGAVFTSNRAFARGAASNPMNGDMGHIITMKGDKLNLMSLKSNATSEFREAFQSFMIANGVDYKVSRLLVNAAKTNGDLLEAASNTAKRFKQPEILEYFNDVIQKSGYDGISFNHVYPDGVSGVADEGMYIFNPSRLTGESIDEIIKAKGLDTNPNVKAQVEAEMNHLRSPESDIHFNKALDDEFNAPPTKYETNEARAVEAYNTTLSKEITELQEIAPLPPAKDPLFYNDLIKDLKACLGVL